MRAELIVAQQQWRMKQNFRKIKMRGLNGSRLLFKLLMMIKKTTRLSDLTHTNILPVNILLGNV